MRARHAAIANSQKWSAADLAAASILFGFVLAGNINTVLNNAYAFGGTFFDSAIFQTIIWRSGWALLQAPTIATNMSYLNVHFSPINYLPNIVSYFAPIDRMSYYGLVYGSIYACLVVLVFHLLLRLSGHRTLLAALGSLLFYLSGPVNSGQWEPHQEIASALFTVGFFIAWGLQRRWTATAMLVLDVMVREDCGILLASPLLLLWVHDRRARTDTSIDADQGILGYAGLAALMSVAAFVVKLLFFNGVDIFSPFYYGEHPFSHLSFELIVDRLQFIKLQRQYLWTPGLVLLAGAIWLRDARLVIGWVAFLPYWLFNFFSILDLNAGLGSYKAFPFVLTMIWPSLLALRSPVRTRPALGIVQIGVLLSATLSWEGGGMHFAAPSGIDALIRRWTLQPEAERAELYRAFESRLDNGSLGAARASMGALALYPYSFPRWDTSLLQAGLEDQAERLDSILWFNGDRDQSITMKWLERGQFPYFYRVIGTRLRLATRSSLDMVPTFAGAIEPIQPP